MQWMMDPYGDPTTNDGADVVNNSWGWVSDSPNMYDPIKDALNAWIAANIVPVFAIGNDGPSPRTTSSPGDYPMALGVGATDSNDNIADFSSRGPVFWEGIGEIIKPDVSAPGVSVYSSVPWGYEYWSGTSMASPHVAGTVALMISYARSQGISLSVDTIKQLLKATAVDLGQSGPDNDYGWGRIDAFAALMPLATDANEPNDDSLQATPVAFGETKLGKIEPDTDEDFFKFTGTQNTVITVKVDAQSLGSGIDAVLQILDSDGVTILAESDDSNGSKDPYIAKFVLPHAGDFYIRLTSKDFSNELRHYALTLKLRSVPNLIATYNPQDNSVTLQWGSVFNSLRLASKRPIIRPLDLQGYRVYRATQVQGPYDLIASLPPDQTTYTDTNLPGQLILYYRVTALYDEGESDPATVRVLADPTEPNDDPTRATQIAYGQSLQGTIAVSGDVDFYKFDGQAGDLVTVEVRAQVDGSPLNSVLTLYNSDGQTVLAFNDDFADWWPVTFDSKLVRFPLPHDGTFYLKIEDSLRSGSENHFYTLTLVKDIPDDHGDWSQNATQIADGQNLSGVINPPPDTDYFVFNANSGDLVIAEIFAERQGSPLDPMLALYDEQGNLLEFNDDYYGLDSAIFYQIPQTGRYFLRVMPFGGSDRGGPDYTYTLSLRVALAEREPNNDPTTATQIAYGDAISGAINPSGDVDFYKFDGQEGDYVTISVEAYDQWQLNAALTLYDSDGQTVLAFNDNFPDWIWCWWNYNPRIVRFPLPHSGTFYLKVENVWDGGGSGNEYSYILTLVKDIPDDHSDWPARATPIISGQPINGVIDPQLDSDYFVFEAQAGYFATAEVFAQREGSPLVPILALHNERGEQIAWAEGWWGWDPYIDIQLPAPGRYYLRVMPSDEGNLGGPDCTYRISLTLQPEPQISVTPTSIEETLLQGSKSVVSVSVTNVGGRSLTFFTRSATSAISTLRAQSARRRIMVVPETSKLYQNYLRMQQQRQQKAMPPQGSVKSAPQNVSNPEKQRELQQVIQKLLAKRNPNSQRLAQALQDSMRKSSVSPSQPTNRIPRQVKPAPFQFTPDPNTEHSIELIPLKGGKPVSILQNEQPPSGTWRWLIVDPDEYDDAINVMKVFYQSDGTYLYFRAELDGGNFDPQNAYFDVFLDTDRNAGTGDRWIIDGMGIDYILYGGLGWVGVFKFNPSTGDFDWVADFVWFKAVNGAVEVGVKLSDIGNPLDLYVACEFYDGNTGRRDRIPGIWYAPITRDVPWLDRSPVAGSLLAGESVNMDVTLDSASLGLGIHKANLVFNSNDLEKQQLTVPVTLTVMQVPNVPELISPADGTIVRPQVTFVLRSTDPDGDRVKFVIEAKKGNEVKTYETGFVESGQEASLTVPEGLSSGEWTWKAKAIDERGQESSFSSEQTFIVNQLPSKPELIAPSNNAIVSPTPIFKLKSTDADGDQVKFEIEVIKGSRVELLVTNFVGSGVEVSLAVPEDQALSPGQWTWKARAIDSKGEAGEWSEARTIQVISVPLIKSGLRLVACPVIGPTDPKSVFAFDGDKWAWFDPTTGYLQYPNNQANLQVVKGYWAKFVQDTKPNVEGNLPDATQPFSITLKKGWNLIGNPWLIDLHWDLSSIKVVMGGQEKALKDLKENEGVEPYAWRWDGSNYRLVYDANVAIIGLDDSLPPWEGAWVYAHTDCELVLPPPSQGKGRGTRGEGRVAKGNGWSIRLQASVNGSVGEAVMGIVNGTRGLAVGLPPDPPTGNNGVQVILLKNNVPLAVDVRSDISRRQEWDVLVRFGTRDGGRGTSERKEVTLTFDGIGYAPKDVSAWLIDTVTGKRLYLRTQTS